LRPVPQDKTHILKKGGPFGERGSNKRGRARKTYAAVGTCEIAGQEFRGGT